jgi:Protein of unknown function (DUF2442)
MKVKVMTTDAELDAALANARNKSEEPRAASVKYWPNLDVLEIVLTNSEREVIPRERLEGLSSATKKQLANVRVEMLGTALSWPDLKVDLYVPALLKGIYGTKKWMSELGRQGGRIKSAAKSEAARRNGAKGGRPRKKRTLVHH